MPTLHWNQDLGVAFACPLSAKRGCEGFLLLRSRELGDQQSVADGDLVFQERLRHGWYQVRESNATIAVCDAPCKSHYFVTAGKVEWLSAFTRAQASNLMRNQIARHASHDRRPSWIETSRAALKRAAKRIRSLLRLFRI